MKTVVQFTDPYNAIPKTTFFMVTKNYFANLASNTAAAMNITIICVIKGFIARNKCAKTARVFTTSHLLCSIES